ncbi:MAG TPA: glycosyltransferase [Opitutaceae bacterium]|jgi:glycosyltransferase involved in cell wall biosynthesis|nr:glycosyltransferase [Opitutaceae bacterium]
MKKDAFVFVVCGERHAARLNLTLKFLKKFSQRDIIVVKNRASLKLDCDQVITPKVPAGLDHHQASIFLKTSLHKTLARERRRFCYLDNDVIAVDPRVDTIFDQARGPVSFAADHCHLGEFSRHAVNCHCTGRECEHLHAAIHKMFGVKITPKTWQHWNGGVFVFDEASAEFMELWHRNTLSVFKDPYWQVRDQGSLVSTVWQLGLQNHPLLPRDFNFIVDPLDRVPRARRDTVQARDLFPNETYALRSATSNGTAKPHPAFLHFINGGVGKRGWKNWDDVEQLLAAKVSRPAQVTHAVKAKVKRAPAKPSPTDHALSADNRIVHGLWIGPTLSKMELLTIKSFLRHGHEFHLWVYDKIQTPLPKEVVLQDANKIIPRSRIFRKADTDTETGVGKGSCSPFSDLFRYKLLYQKGGYWVDMDVTCLRPFNFKEPYVFRPHRVGVVGNIMKCPPRSRLMKILYQKVARRLNDHSEWLMTNRLLSETIQQVHLTRYIRTGIWNEESWWDVIRPLALGDTPIPPGWFGIHWINEFWRALKQQGGFYRGKRLFDVVPEKENPKPGSALAKLYAEYGLTTASTNGSSANGAPAKQNLEIPLNQPAPRQPVTPQFLMPSHINILLPSLARGGAERSVLETLTGLQRRNSSAKLFVLYGIHPSYAFNSTANVQVFRLNQSDLQVRLHTVAAEVLASPEPLVFTHMIKAEFLRPLWERGVKTVPVIQNARPAWQDSPAAFDHPNVPFVVAVSEAVAEQLREDQCPCPVVVMRHELQRWFTPEEQQENRRIIRERHGIANDTLVIGMVGAFKAQKAYTRAVRVLAQIRKIRPVKLMILGSWDHEWGHGRHAYAATCRLALEMNVITDLLTLGPVPDAERYYAAFDVFLNTSAYEGLSVALQEAIQTGCPIVTADAGGNAEILPERAVLIQDSSDISAYVAAIAQLLKSSARTLVQKPNDFDLVPRLWCLLGRYGRVHDSSRPAAKRAGTLFLTENLNIGGAQRSLMNLLCSLPRTDQAWLCVLETIYGQGYLDVLEKSGVPVFSVHNSTDYLDRLERLLCLIERLNVRNVCFWNVEPRLKLLLAKILPPASVRLIDVSPGPALFAEMERTRAFQRRISFRAVDYWARLDHFVAKYQDGAPPGLRADGRKVVVIPNGVPAPLPAESKAAPLPPGADPHLVIGTACRIMPGKRIDFLIDIMAELNAILPGATLIIVGGVDPRHADYWPQLVARLRSKQVANIHFVGPHSNVTPFLRLFKAFVMLSDQHGCPNASLEAMAMGLPVIANSAGGTAEQVRHGVNGFLVTGEDPKEMAQHVRHLLVDQVIHRRFSAAARATAAKDFPMDLMTRRYRQLLEGSTRKISATPAVPRMRTPALKTTRRHSRSPIVNKR